jgi:hypothetical protein
VEISKLVVHLITRVSIITWESITMESNYTLITKAEKLLYLEWKIKVHHVYREANQAAD